MRPVVADDVSSAEAAVASLPVSRAQVFDGPNRLVDFGRRLAVPQQHRLQLLNVVVTDAQQSLTGAAAWALGCVGGLYQQRPRAAGRP